MKSRNQETAVVALCAVLGWGAPAWSGAGDVGDCDPPNVEVRAKLGMRNNTGQDANDFHFYMYQNDRPNVVVTGAKAGSAQCDNVNVALSTDNGTGNPPPGNHGANVDMSGCDIPNGEAIEVEISLCMNEKNVLKIKDAYFTSDGQKLEGKPMPDQGWRTGRPFPGGDGGNRTPGGGGRGAQEGSGGGGHWIHRVCIENDDTSWLVLENLKLLASMTYYPALDAIDWASVLPIQDANGEPPVCIPPGGRWCYDFQTTGSYLGGHVYLYYTIRPAAPGECGSPAASRLTLAQSDEPLEEFGDHPVDALETDALAGLDFWQTHDPTVITFGGTLPPIPADFFGPGSEPFVGTVALKGVALDPCTSNADTIVRRPADAWLPFPGASDAVPIELVALNQSTAPIRVEYRDGTSAFFDVFLTADHRFVEVGIMQVMRGETGENLFGMQIQYVPQVTFVPVGGGPPLFLPELPAQTMFSLSPGPWDYAPPIRPIPGSGPNFYALPAVQHTMVQADGSPHTLVPARARPAPDFDCDGDVDVNDFAVFQTCFNGPGNPPSCDWDADFDDDGDADVNDFAVFQACFNGPGQPAACP